MRETDISIVAGDSVAVEFILTTDVAVVDISGFSFEAKIVDTRSDSVVKDFDVQVFDPALGKIRFYLAANNTDLDKSANRYTWFGKYRYMDVEKTFAWGPVRVV